MKINDWKAVLELVGIAGIIVSLLFVGIQLRQDQDIAIAQIYADYDDTQIEWARLIAENREVWLRGLKDEDLSEEDAAVFYAMAVSFFSKESGRHRRALLVTGVAAEGIVTRNAQFYFTYPGLMRAWRTWTTYYRVHDLTPSFQQYLDAVDVVIGQIEDGSLAAQPHTTYAPMQTQRRMRAKLTAPS